MSDSSISTKRDDFAEEERKIQNVNDVMAKLLWNLDTLSLLQLKQFFNKLEDGSSSEDVPRYDLKKHREKRTYYISKKDFEIAISTVFGHTEFKNEANRLFDSLDDDRSGFIWWEHLLDELIECGEIRTRRNLEGWSPVRKDKIKIIDVAHCKKECVSFIVPIETATTFCYVIISKYGKVGVYDGKLKMLSEYDVFFLRTGVSRRVRDIWITAAINLEDSKNLILAASDRTLTIYDSSTLYHMPIFLITGVPYIPTFMAYDSSQDTLDRSCLIMGDDHGGISLVTFKQPRVGLFFKQIQDKMNTIAWIDLQCILQEPFCDIRVYRRLHTRPVKKLIYIKLSDSIVSCSSDPNASLIIKHKKGTRESYIFKVTKGISCFHYSVNMNILMTGSSDGRVRIWDPLITQKPTAVLPTQNASIMDVVVLSHMSAAITFNKNGELKIWDILNTVCTQSLHIPYPSFGILGRLIQFGSLSIYNGPGRKCTKEIKVKDVQKPVPKLTQSVCDGIEDAVKVISLEEEETKGSTFEKVADDEKNTELSKWTRPEILVACCNHIAVVPIHDVTQVRYDKELEYRASSATDGSGLLLPPPEKSHRPRKPSIWSDQKFSFDQTSRSENSKLISEELKTEPLSHIEHTRHILSSSDSKSEEELRCRSIVDTDDMSLDDLLERAGLTGILEKDFVKQFGIKHDLNARLALQKTKMEKMHLQVSQGAPYSTLELQEPQDIRFAQPLPLSTRMQNKTGLLFFTDPQQILRHNSCFSMSTPRSTYTVSSRHSSNKSDT